MTRENKCRKSTRRDALKSIGIGAAVTTTIAPIISTGVAAQNSKQTTANELGLGEKIRSLLINGEREQALQLLRKHGIPYSSESHVMPGIGSGGSKTQTESPTISPEDEWDIRYSEYDCIAYLNSESIYGTTSTWNLNGAGPYESSGPLDAVGVTCSSDLWEPVLGSESTDSRTTLEDEGPQGVIFRFDDPDGPIGVSDSDTIGHVYYEFEKTESGTHNLYPSYVHNWCPGGACGTIGFSLNVPYIGFSITGRVDTWEKKASLSI